MKRFLYIFILACFSVVFIFACNGNDDDSNDVAGKTDDDADAADDDDDDDDTGGGNDDADDDTEPQTFRIAVISDLNIMADDLVEGNTKINNTVQILNARNDIDFVLILGDVASRFYYWWWDEFNPNYDPNLTWEDSAAQAVSILSALNKPYYIIPGEKDYMDWLELDFGFDVTWADRDQRTAQLRQYYGSAMPGEEMWYAFDHKGVRFFAANTLAGPLWDESNGMTGSLGQDQLDAIESEIAGDSPVILLMHHSGVAVLEPDGDRTLDDVLSAKTGNVLALFNGHHWSYVDYTYGGVDATGFDAVFENENNYAIVEIDPNAPSVEIVNREDLGFPPDYENFSCTPGESTADLSNLEGTFHTLFIEQMDTDYWVLNMLLAAADLGNTPFGLWVYADNGDGTYQVQLTQGDIASKEMYPYAADYCVVNWPLMLAPCEMYTWDYNEPCMQTQNAVIEYNLMKMIDEWGDHASCGVGLYYETDFLFEAKMGDDADGNMTFDSGQISLTLEKAKIIAALQRFMVDSYCTYDCNLGEQVHLMTPEDQCDAQANGDAAACDAGTLTFDDVPDICDTKLGNLYAIPVRLVMNLIEKLPETMTVDFRFRGWGHEMSLVWNAYDLDQDYSMLASLWHYQCPEQPVFGDR